MTILPQRIKRDSGRKEQGRRCPSHRKWVRGHACCACGSQSAIECAHVRVGTDGGTGIKPSDRWVISLCRECHSRQHQIGEESFEKAWGINLKALAEAFFKGSPHRFKLEGGDA
jgi:hypothetical protein